MTEREPLHKPNADVLKPTEAPKREPPKPETPEAQHERIARESGNTSWR